MNIPLHVNLLGWYEMELPCLKIFIYFYSYYWGLKVIYKHHKRYG